MHVSPRTLALVTSIALCTGGFAAWHHTRGTAATAPSAVASPPCEGATEACGAHAAPKDLAAAPRVEGHPRLLAFSSHDCPACNRMHPVLEAAIKACDGEKTVERVDFDDEAGEALAKTYDVRFLPSFVSVDASGQEVSRLTGVQSPEVLEHALEEVHGIRCASVDHAEDKRPL